MRPTRRVSASIGTGTRSVRCASIKPERIAEYKRLHGAAWPEILARISEYNIRNCTIFLRMPENLLFGYWKYHGEDFSGDSARMAADPRTRAWWALADPMQVPLVSRAEGEHWSTMEEVLHHD
nr:L-rhamnose mutarotase [Bradyrhizobium brasilense]